MKEKKWELQLKQLQVPMSDTFTYFLQCLLRLDKLGKEYFIQSLKLGLNERSVKLLQPLYEEYEQWRLEDESEERENQLKDLDERLNHSSLGIEHFYREMAVLYENMAAFQKTVNDAEIENIMDVLCDIMADALLTGTAIEVVDGDAVSVPITWLKAVLDRIEEAQKSTLFRVSVLGALSAGKSHPSQHNLWIELPSQQRPVHPRGLHATTQGRWILEIHSELRLHWSDRH